MRSDQQTDILAAFFTYLTLVVSIGSVLAAVGFALAGYKLTYSFLWLVVGGWNFVCYLNLRNG